MKDYQLVALLKYLYHLKVNLLESELQTLLERVSRTPGLQQVFGLMGKRSSGKIFSYHFCTYTHIQPLATLLGRPCWVEHPLASESELP